MAEGGIEMDEMGRGEGNDDYDEDYDDYDIYDDYDDIEFQNLINKETMERYNLSDGDKTIHDEKIKKKMLKRFFLKINESLIYRYEDNFYFEEDQYERPMLYIRDSAGNEVPLTYYNTSKKTEIIRFYTLTTLLGKYHINFIRHDLGIEDYDSPTTVIKHGRAEFQETIRKQQYTNANERIDKITKRIKNITGNITTERESIELLDITNNTETSVKEINTEIGTQTNIEHREMESIMKAMTTVKEEITNELGKLTETNKHIAKENRKLKQAKEDNDEYQIKRISERIRNLESERSARLEVININKDKLRNQINRIKQTIHKILNEDTTLKEKIKTLFREQGVTIVSILTAFGMIIGTIVNTFSGEGGGGETPSKGKGGIKEWITRQIKKLGKLLANLAGKAASALPGIIGAIVSWLLSVTGNIVNWFANNLWMLLILVVGLLYTAAREYINKSHK
jgi:hypothetical protein